MSRRFWICTALALPVFILAMIADMMPSWLPDRLSMQAVQWIEFALATPVVLWGGWPFFVRGWQSVRTWNLNMFTLIALGVSVAWVYSVVALLFPRIFPPAMQMEGGMVARLLRSRGRDHGAGASGTGPGTAGPLTNQCGHQGAARPGTEDGAHRSKGWNGRRYPSGACAARRYVASPTRRESAGGRHGRRRSK